NLVPVVATV
nr:Chain P, HCMV pp65 fragment 495-503, variant M5V (NLVPVVATV) [synthetic construct]